MSSTDHSADSVATFTSLQSTHKLLVVLFYRGGWCPFCLHYIKQLQQIRSEVLKAGGESLLVTAEPAERLPATLAATKYDGPVAADIETKLPAYLKEKNLIEVVVSEKAGYSHGMIQSGVLIITKDGRVLEKYAQQPYLLNLSGALGRPDLVQTWENALADYRNEPRKHAEYYTHGVATGIKQRLFG